MPTPEHNFEWLKILVSTTAGLFVGLIAEPIKSTMQRKIEVVRLERAIGMDCLGILANIASTRTGLVTETGKFWKHEILPAYHHYWVTKRELFYADFDLQIIHLKCATIDQVVSNVVEHGLDPDAAFTEIEAIANEIIRVRSTKKGLRPRLRRFLLRFVT